MKILFITTSNLATNPRIYKEIVLARALDYEVEIICFEFRNWSYEYNRQLLDTLDDCELHIIPANKTPFFPWMMSVMTERLFRMTEKLVSLPVGFLSQAVSRRSDLINRVADKIKGDINWVIAHNPGAFYPALRLSDIKNARLGIDLEDFHPGETNDTRDKKRLERLIRYVLPKADYITAASPLIMKETMDLSPSGAAKEVVLNYFPVKEFLEPREDNGENLRLVWFSQNISSGRGLETIIPVVDRLSGIELHLFGHMNEDFFNKYLKGKKNIFVHPALSQTELHKMLSEFDIGLAIEPGKDENNEIAVSNKILAYFQAGLYILASNTLAQQDFLQRNHNHGVVLSLDEESVRSRLFDMIQQKYEIRKNKKLRFINASTDNWESESKKLTTLWSA